MLACADRVRIEHKGKGKMVSLTNEDKRAAKFVYWLNVWGK